MHMHGRIDASAMWSMAVYFGHQGPSRMSVWGFHWATDVWGCHAAGAALAEVAQIVESPVAGAGVAEVAEVQLACEPVAGLSAGGFSSL